MSKLHVKVEAFKALRSNTLFGFADLVIPEMHLRIIDATVHESHGKRWISLPAKPQITRDGTVRRDERHRNDTPARSGRRSPLSPVALRVALHDPRPIPDHEHAAGLLRDRSFECGAGQGERQIATSALVRSMFAAVDLEPRADDQKLSSNTISGA